MNLAFLGHSTERLEGEKSQDCLGLQVHNVQEGKLLK